MATTKKKAPKTKLKQAAAHQSVKPLATYIGETEKNLKQVFELRLGTEKGIAATSDSLERNCNPWSRANYRC
jgi:hypothetical protein